jgi:V/A-type H+-transporting ATPase subunit E
MTDNKLQELIETLKKQGVESGEMASRKITEGAQKKADEIITRAKSDADGILARAKEDADRQRKQLHSSMEIAATQLISDLKRTIEQNLIALPLRKKLSEHLSDTAFLKELIAACVREYIKDTGRVELDILVSKEQQEKLSGEISFGFIIGKADNAVRLDFTDEAFLELFLRYLSHRFREFFKTIDVKELSNP